MNMFSLSIKASVRKICIVAEGHVKLYHKSSLVSPNFRPQFLIFQKNTCAETSMFLIFRSVHQNFVEKLKFVSKIRRN